MTHSWRWAYMGLIGLTLLWGLPLASEAAVRVDLETIQNDIKANAQDATRLERLLRNCDQQAGHYKSSVTDFIAMAGKGRNPDSKKIGDNGRKVLDCMEEASDALTALSGDLTGILIDLDEAEDLQLDEDQLDVFKEAGRLVGRNLQVICLLARDFTDIADGLLLDDDELEQASDELDQADANLLLSAPSSPGGQAIAGLVLEGTDGIDILCD